VLLQQKKLFKGGHTIIKDLEKGIISKEQAEVLKLKNAQEHALQ
jgi:tetrahydromethanopterin S-methyltransferase subunit H